MIQQTSRDYNSGLKTMSQAHSASSLHPKSKTSKKDPGSNTFYNATGTKLKFGGVGLNDGGSPEGKAMIMNRRNSATSRRSKGSGSSEQMDKMSMKSHQSRVNFARAKPNVRPGRSLEKKGKSPLTKGILSKFDDSNTGSLPRIGEVTGKKKKAGSSLTRKDIVAQKQFLQLQNKSVLAGIGDSSRKALSTLDTISQSNSNASTTKFRLGGTGLAKSSKRAGSLSNTHQKTK
jgi:hypothetical protein